RVLFRSVRPGIAERPRNYASAGIPGPALCEAHGKTGKVEAGGLGHGMTAGDAGIELEQAAGAGRLVDDELGQPDASVVQRRDKGCRVAGQAGRGRTGDALYGKPGAIAGIGPDDGGLEAADDAPVQGGEVDIAAGTVRHPL